MVRENNLLTTSVDAEEMMARQVAQTPLRAFSHTLWGSEAGEIGDEKPKNKA